MMKKLRNDKVSWSGRIVAVQPQINMLRSFDQRYRHYVGYILRVIGNFGDEIGEFLVAIGKIPQSKYKFCAGMIASGVSVPVDDPQKIAADFFKTTGLKVSKIDEHEVSSGPPFRGAPPDLDVYRERGSRRLDTKTYNTKCTACIWGCRMAVEMIVDPWNPSKKQYRFETCCFGPKNCEWYRAGATRKVPGRNGMSWEEADWIDEEATAHRREDE